MTRQMERDWWSIIALLSYILGSFCFAVGSAIMLWKELTK